MLRFLPFHGEKRFKRKRPAAHSLRKEFAAGLHAPDILAVFERVSSICSVFCVLCSVFCVLCSVFCVLCSVKDCTGRILCVKGFSEKMLTFFAPGYIFSPTIYLLGWFGFAHQPDKPLNLTLSNYNAFL